MSWQDQPLKKQGATQVPQIYNPDTDAWEPYTNATEKRLQAIEDKLNATLDVNAQLTGSLEKQVLIDEVIPSGAIKIADSENALNHKDVAHNVIANSGHDFIVKIQHLTGTNDFLGTEEFVVESGTISLGVTEKKSAQIRLRIDNGDTVDHTYNAWLVLNQN